MNLPFFHASLTDLTEFRSDQLSGERRRRVAAHLRDCSECQGRLRFLTRVDDAMAAPTPDAPSRILERALASRAAGERLILNVETHGTVESDRRIRRAVIAAASAIAATAVLFVGLRTTPLEAVASQSELRFTPLKPRVGDTLHITYRSAVTALQRERQVTLRARLRTSRDDMYAGAVPGSQIRGVARLDRQSDGTFSGRFVLPDSIVFATLVVEDSNGVHLDDNSGRDWEILTYAADNRPTYEALNERADDMMGRSWEQAYASGTQLSTLYPDRISSWTLREFFDRAMYGDKTADSLGKAYEPRIDSMIEARKSAAGIPEGELSDIFYRHLTAILHGGTHQDSVRFEYWRARLMREHPHASQIGQYYAINFRPEDWKRPDWMLDSLEHLYAKLAPVFGHARVLFSVAQQLVSQSKDDAVYRRWVERSMQGVSDSAYRVALAFASRPGLRAEGEQALRALLNGPVDALAPFRRLAETQGEYVRRASDVRRTVLVALGRALAADGRMAAATDTLGLAAAGVWDLDVFRALTAAYVSIADTTAADRIRARLAVDSRTLPDSAKAIGVAVSARVGAAVWDSLLTSARDEMHQRFLERSKVRSLSHAPHLLLANGTSVELHTVTGGKPAAVIFWSRECGWALQALPAITSVAERLMKAGVPVVFVAGAQPSAEVNSFLASKGWKLPVYYDSGGEMSNAFANFGTPAYYAIDAAGRIRFDQVSDEAQLFGQLEALRSETQP